MCKTLIFRIISLVVALSVTTQLCSANILPEENSGELTEILEELTKNVKARVGVAVVIDGEITAQVNGNESFPMMSVFKFPVALAVAEWCDTHGLTFDRPVKIMAEELKENTYSPMLVKYGKTNIEPTIRELLAWALIESDNNACDILINRIGGIEGINTTLAELDIPEGIRIGATEDDMHTDASKVSLNTSTPEAMAELFYRFNHEFRYRSSSFSEIAEMLEGCKTGTDRILGGLPLLAYTVGHKTGTGDVLQDGRISAVNDCGYVNIMPEKDYALAIFVADAAYDMPICNKIISDISRKVYRSYYDNYLNNKFILHKR